MNDHGFSRVAAVVPQLHLADPLGNVAELLPLLDIAEAAGCSLVVAPEMGLTGYTCNDLFFQARLLETALEALRKLRDSNKFAGLLCVGLPLVVDDQIFNVAAMLHGGKILGIVPKSYLPNYKEFYDARFFAPAISAISNHVMIDGLAIPFGTDLLFAANDIDGLVVGVEICEDLWCPVPPSSLQALHGATVLANLSASNEIIGKASYRRQLVSQQSARCLAAYIYASSGPGESSTDIVFGGHALIAENSSILAESQRFRQDGHLIMADIDRDRLRFNRLQTTSFADANLQLAKTTFRRIEWTLGERSRQPELIRPVEAHPFVPADEEQLQERCEEIFAIQTTALARRLQAAGLPTLAIGVSGGLDSTLALLVLVRALDLLKVPRSNVKALTMPGFGTTGRTRGNAIALMQALDIGYREIDIRSMCLTEMQELGHAPFGIALKGLDVAAFEAKLTMIPASLRHDLTFENVQARRRTSLLMNTGFTIGTGDLSELALGWCTYNADQTSMYNPNVSIPKTLVRFLVQWSANNVFTVPASGILHDIAATPISPELLPLGSEGQIQSTEDTIGPYELHDFFMYQLLRYGMTPAKIVYLAGFALFDREYTTAEITSWLRLFLKRFFAQQYKRSCLPDGPKVGSVSLSPRGDWRMPSDASAKAWLGELSDK